METHPAQQYRNQWKTYCGFNASTYLVCLFLPSLLLYPFSLFAEAQQLQIHRRSFFLECVSFSYNFTCDTPHNQFTQFFIGLVFVHRMKRLLASMNDNSTHTHTNSVEKKRIGEEKNPSKPRRNLTIINQFSIFRLHLTLCACYQKHILNQYLVRRSLINIHGRHLPFIRLFDAKVLLCHFSYFLWRLFLLLLVQVFFSSGSFSSGRN